MHHKVYYDGATMACNYGYEADNILKNIKINFYVDVPDDEEIYNDYEDPNIGNDKVAKGIYNDDNKVNDHLNENHLRKDQEGTEDYVYAVKV